jgi:hypothetical protein
VSRTTGSTIRSSAPQVRAWVPEGQGRPRDRLSLPLINPCLAANCNDFTKPTLFRMLHPNTHTGDYPNTFNGICGGDSGSPLVRRGTAAGGSEDLLVGVASFASSKCGQYAEKPSEWIRQSGRLNNAERPLAEAPVTAVCAGRQRPRSAFAPCHDTHSYVVALLQALSPTQPS